MLARFRASPRTVRVSVQRVGCGWYATVRSLVTGSMVSSWNTGPRKALVQALRWAERSKMPGIDLGLGWAYEHPQKPGEGVVT